MLLRGLAIQSNGVLAVTTQFCELSFHATAEKVHEIVVSYGYEWI